MGAKLNKSIDCVRDGYAFVRDAFYWGEHSGWEWMQMVRHWRDQWDNLVKRHKLPHWATAKVEGYWDACVEEMYRSKVKWQLYLDGQKIESRDVPTGRWIDVKGQHEWIQTGVSLSGLQFVSNRATE